MRNSKLQFVQPHYKKIVDNIDIWGLSRRCQLFRIKLKSTAEQLHAKLRVMIGTFRVTFEAAVGRPLRRVEQGRPRVGVVVVVRLLQPQPAFVDHQRPIVVWKRHQVRTHPLFLAASVTQRWLQRLLRATCGVSLASAPNTIFFTASAVKPTLPQDCGVVVVGTCPPKTKVEGEKRVPRPPRGRLCIPYS